jgi:head-tail adaptor
MAQRPRWLKQRRRLDQKITIQRRGVGTNEMNEPNADWADVFSTRAAAYPSPGFERSISDQNVATEPMTFEVRSESRTRAILPTDRVRWDSRTGKPTYEIVAPVEQPERGSNLRITTAADRK